MKQFPGCNPFLSHVSQKRVGHDKGAAETKTDVESHST